MDLALPSWNLTDDSNSTLPLPEPSNSTNQDELFQGYSSALLMFASVSCVIFILIGIPGNLITIIALAKCKKVRNATAVFIINLSLSDLLFCCFNLPLAASTFWRNTWAHGELLCRLFPLMRYGLLAVSLFTVLAITINRYVMIGHPRIYPRIYRRRYLAIMVASTWFCAFGILIPTWRGAWGTFGLDRSIGSCTILRDQNGTSPKEFLFIMAFIIPCISIIACYARIFYIVRKTAMRSHEPFQASVRMMKSQRMNAQDGNQSDRQLFSKSSKTSKDENSENSSSISNSSGYPVPAISQKNSMRSKLGADTQPDVQEDEVKFLDPKCTTEQHRTLSILKKMRKEGTPLNSVSAFKEISLKEPGILSKLSDVDSAVEDSMSSADNNQIYHITSSTDISNQLLSVQVEPSSSSGLDLPLEQEHYQRRKVFKKIFKSSLTKISKRSYKPSTMNSGSSILYPGRMTQKDRRLLKMILVIFLSFLVCYLPITITKIWKGVTEVHLFNIMGYILIYLTTCINPIIYVVMSSEYRQAYWNLLLCKTLAAQSSNIPIRAKSKETKAKVKSFRD